MDHHISPRLYENKNKDKKNISLGSCQTGGNFPGRPRMDTGKYLNSQLKNVDIGVKSQTSKSSEQSSTSNGSRARVLRTKPMLPTISCDTMQYMCVDVGQENHLEVIQAKAGEVLTLPAPQIKSSRWADASSQHGDRICSGPLFVSQAKPVQLCEVNFCKDSAKMGVNSKPSSFDSLMINKLNGDQLGSLALANSTDKSVINDSSDTSMTITDLPGDDWDNFFKGNPPLEAKIVWREGLIQRWKRLKNGEIDALLLLRNCADLEQKFPQPTRFGDPSAKSEHCPSSPGSDTSTTSNLSLLSSVWSGQSYYKPLNKCIKPFTPANQISKARSDESHEVAAIPATITVHPFHQICLQANRCLDTKRSNCSHSKPEEEERESHHDLICYKSSVENKPFLLKTPSLSADYRMGSISKKDDSYHRYSKDYVGNNSVALQNCNNWGSHATLVSRKSMTTVQEQISEHQKDAVSMTKAMTRRPFVWTHGTAEDATNTIHYETRKPGIPFLNEVQEFQGIRDVHVVEISPQYEAVGALSSSSVGLSTQLKSDLIPNPNASFSDIKNIKIKHPHQKICTNTSSRSNIWQPVSGSSSPTCKADQPEEQGYKHRTQKPATAKQLASSRLDHVADDEELCRCYHHSQAMDNKAENCNSSYTYAIAAATASAGLLVVGTCLIGYICHRRFGRFRKLRLNFF